MNNKIKTIISYILMAWLSGCGSEITASSPADLRQKFDSLKQHHDIKEDFYGDNFDYSQFEGIDWRDSSTFGGPCSGTCVGPTTDPIPDHALFPELGISKDNYSIVTIKGDGSCWIRSVIQVVLFQAFQDRAVFNSLIENIRKANTSLAVVPGFSARFRGEDLINLLTTLNALSPKERLAQFNKTKVDLFLDYSMRSYIHAKRLVDEKDVAPQENQKNLKKILTSHSWGSSHDANVWLSTLLPDDHIFPYLFGFNFKSQRPANLSVLTNDIKYDSNTVRKYGEVFRNDRRTLTQLKNELTAKQHALDQPEHLELKTVNSLPREIFELQLHIFYKEVAKAGGINSVADFHRHPSFCIFSYPQYEGHVSLMVHNNARAAFGY